ncbi:hypothetical protein EIN_521150 [Entamoeba invadens IP1]|uniref:Uncharacterized protein n=1 Tax=Entamoeba invadens IP1 TaxID=370355 RepID=A0A0A1UFL2_ENTIV|nr:hypothetical protein EIN_521150 [Entamoeba invadens IP1]ELP91728.1 hypothetical protein EIN_521150 [Entamoeba invadens IP1]|eukprot:XP_004258499.1 hypothetical protein EIN_521150 [Entamoeba invadens IP1]
MSDYFLPDYFVTQSDGTYYNTTGPTSCKGCDSLCSSYCNSCVETTYSTAGSLSFQQCDTKCDGCDATNGYCVNCVTGYGLAAGKCAICLTGTYYLYSACKSCGEMEYQDVVGQTTYKLCDSSCASCSEKQMENVSCMLLDMALTMACVHCKCDRKSGACTSCEAGNKRVDNRCVLCAPSGYYDLCTDETSDGCQIADYVNNQHICTACFAPYVTSSDLKACNLGYTTTTYFNTNDHQLHTNMNVCINQIDTLCYLCDLKTMLLNGVCNVKNEKCETYSQHGCDKCVSDVITSNGNCAINTTNCKYEINRESGTKCLYCVDDVLCGKAKQHCGISHNEYCYLAVNGYHTTNNNTVEQCESEVCVISNGVITILKCQNNKVLIDGACTTNTMCSIISSRDCFKCDAKHHFSHGICLPNNPNCDNQNGDVCIVCNNAINVDGVCTNTQSIHCSSFDKVCVICESGYYKDVDGCKEQIGALSNCGVVSSLNTKCVECESDYFFDGILCVPQTLPNETIKQTTKNEETQTDSHCEVSTTKGCLRCFSGYYLADRMCVKCEYPCVFCSNQTFCTKCDDYSYANSNGICTEINELVNGYMLSYDGSMCISCDVSCKSCTNEGNCVVCDDEFYRTSSNVTKLCSPQSELTSCANKTTAGCVQCEGGHHLSNNLCVKCQDTCTQCYGIDECTDCVKDSVFVSSVCSH